MFIVIRRRASYPATQNEHRLLIECSTIDVETARAVARQISKPGQGVDMDAPVPEGYPSLTLSSVRMQLILYTGRSCSG